MTEREELEGGIAALEAQRAVLGDAVVDTALAALRARLARLDVPEQQLKPVTILLTRAHSLLTERAMLLEEADRRTFLGSVPWHREIMKACAAPI